MIFKINANMLFKARKAIAVEQLKPEIIEQLPAHGKWITSAIEVKNEGPVDYLEITQGDEIAKFVSRFENGKLVLQEESYNNNKPAIWIFNEAGSKVRIKEKEEKAD